MSGRVWSLLERDYPQWVSWAFGAVIIVGFIGGLVFLGVRDHRATQRCEALGGATWDYGTHCVLGSPEVVSTR